MEGSDLCEECKDEASFRRKPATVERKIGRCWCRGCAGGKRTEIGVRGRSFRLEVGWLIFGRKLWVGSKIGRSFVSIFLGVGLLVFPSAVISNQHVLASDLGTVG
jgi:hypothetical protein